MLISPFTHEKVEIRRCVVIYSSMDHPMDSYVIKVEI